MRSPILLFLAAFLALASFASAWNKEDHEIFDLVSALEAAEGKGINFYSFVGVEPGATVEVINKAYRKKSMVLHPDKNPGVKNIQERFARLGVITNILRDPTKRERYNFFYKNGVPVWRGTGYYYSRFRPSLIHVVFFLVLVSTGFHWLILQMNYRRDRRRIDYFVRQATNSGSGTITREGSSTPPTGKANDNGDMLAKVMNQVGSSAGEAGAQSAVVKPRKETRKEREKREKEQAAAANGTILRSQAKRRKVKVPLVEGVEGGSTLDLVVIGDAVFIPEEDGHLTPIDSLVEIPSSQSLWPVKLASSLMARAKSAAGIASAPSIVQATDVDEDDLDDTEGEAAEASNTDSATSASEKPSKSNKKRPAGNAKIAGMRRRKALLTK